MGVGGEAEYEYVYGMIIQWTLADPNLNHRKSECTAVPE